jgi:AraC-like DNA-binding protein
VPKRYYLQMRLRRARELLLQTSMPIIDITTACGFQSPPHFSRCYRAQFGCPPSAERQIRHTHPAARARLRRPGGGLARITVAAVAAGCGTCPPAWLPGSHLP